MATYFVEINNKFMVKLNYDGSACGAEHHFLDTYNHIWGANAFDVKSMKTDCFIGSMIHDELISEEALVDEIRRLCDIDLECEKKAMKIKELDEKVLELERQLSEARLAREAANKDWLITVDEWKDQNDRLNATRP